MCDCTGTIFNCLFVGNSANYAGGGITLRSGDGGSITNCTFSKNSAIYGSAMCVYSPDIQVSDCVIHGEDPDAIYSVYSSSPPTYCCIEGWEIGDGGEGNFSDDPLFVAGPWGDYYLSSVGAGQPDTSPCIDSGSGPAANFDLAGRTVRTDGQADAGIVDIGYHHPTP